jgi:tetratricopeptide (TPR) repeat protein
MPRQGPSSPRTPRTFRPSDGALQLLAAALGCCLYVVLLVGVKWEVYPGWTWRGYLTDVHSLVGLAAFAAGFLFWLFRVYRVKAIEDVVHEQVRRTLQSRRVASLVAALSASVTLGSAAVIVRGERDVAVELLEAVQESNWGQARALRDALATQPLRPSLQQTLRHFVDVHELSERDRLRESRSLREDIQRVRALLDAGEDNGGFNSLTFAELSKGLFFVEDAGDPKRHLQEGIDWVTGQAARVSDPFARPALLARAGELHLAGKDYASARSMFDQALALEARSAARSRIRANIANTLAATGDTATAVRLYSESETDYPEGRRSIFYSNYGYLLMLARDYDAARQKVELALQIDPEDWYSHLNLGLIKESLGTYDDASEDFRIVIEQSTNPDSKREAGIFAGRCLELAGRTPTEYLPFYLRAAGRSSTPEQITRLLADRHALSALYDRMAVSLENTNTHAIETYITWFRTRATDILRDGRADPGNRTGSGVSLAARGR